MVFQDMQRLAVALDIKDALRMDTPALVDAIESREGGTLPCFSQAWSAPCDIADCPLFIDCSSSLSYQAAREKLIRQSLPRHGLVLAQNISVGYQVSTLLEKNGWQIRVAHNDDEAYGIIQYEKNHAVIADINTSGLGGLAVLSYCHHRHPAIDTFAITRFDNDYAKMLAHDAGGCLGYFYLTEGNRRIDTHHGLAADLIAAASD